MPRPPEPGRERAPNSEFPRWNASYTTGRRRRRAKLQAHHRGIGSGSQFQVSAASRKRKPALECPIVELGPSCDFLISRCCAACLVESEAAGRGRGRNGGRVGGVNARVLAEASAAGRMWGSGAECPIVGLGPSCDFLISRCCAACLVESEAADRARGRDGDRVGGVKARVLPGMRVKHDARAA
jgi:hypothetical protein